MIWSWENIADKDLKQILIMVSRKASQKLGHLVVHDGINGHSDAVLGQNLLRGHVERDRPIFRHDYHHVYVALLIIIIIIISIIFFEGARRTRPSYISS